MTATGPAVPTSAPAAGTTPDVVALGESMVTFRPSEPGRLADVPSFDRGIGGAESNVACVLAAAGHRSAWISRVGADGFGDHLVEAIGAYGVDTSAVRRDLHRPTGIYFRTAGDRASAAHEVAYYRAGSAASAMSPANLDLDALRSGRILHLSGITAALSASCLDLLRTLVSTRTGSAPLVSFDVNYRPGLWPGSAEGPDVLLELARRADIVFVGDDEAEDAWGITGGPDAIREALPEPSLLVVKRGADGAVAYDADGRHDEPAPRVDVVAAVGAGDAFAAGFLSATLRGLPVAERLRHGHLWAAVALTEPGDLAAPPSRARADRLVGLDADRWGRLHVGPGWADATGEATDREAAEEEVRTP
ncbi:MULTISPECIES: sugar kinase [unclassified Streptomyces]|uniref:sugar kinase n=1 Tax=unclassified Streptomyces TaxID=2593676 RepID=UPI00278BBCA4|nr:MULTISPECIES: sugar kinase [unclassified Streptomyces]